MSKHANSETRIESSPSKKARFSIDKILESSIIKKKLLPPPSPSSSNGSEPEESKEENSEIEESGSTILTGNWIPIGNSAKLVNLSCKLEGKELWTKFFDLSTEMIITKSGRRMFPTVKVRLENCDLDGFFYVFLDVIPVDDRRYRYVYNKSAWLTAGKAEPSPESRVYMHPDSPFPGRQLASQIISFEKAKLTNSDVDRTGHLVLNSMHKYQPRIHVVRRDRSNPIPTNRVDLRKEEYKTFVFSETQFMAVTAYQNQLITKLKIEKNPFAKGFRDPSGRSTEIELERHLERLPRFPFNGLQNPAAMAAAALMFGQFPIPGFPMHQNQPPSDWIFANLAAAAVFNPMNQSNLFPKLSFLPNLAPTSTSESSKTLTTPENKNQNNCTENDENPLI